MKSKLSLLIITAAFTSSCIIYPYTNKNYDKNLLKDVPIVFNTFPDQKSATAFCNSKMSFFKQLISFGANGGCSRYNTRTKVCEIYVAKQLVDNQYIISHELANCASKISD